MKIFHHKDNALWGWEQSFKDICNAYTPFKDVKARSMSALWINNTIRHKMNSRFKLLKEASRTKDPSKWAAHKKLRNEITADISRAKAEHFKDLLADVKTTAEYWNMLSKANNTTLQKAIGPLKREDGSLAVDDKEKSITSSLTSERNWLAVSSPNIYPTGPRQLRLFPVSTTSHCRLWTLREN